MLSRLSQLSAHIARSTTVRTLTTMASKPSDITLYTAQTPNGIKISILLEELGLPYKVHRIDFAKNEQKEPWFLEINPNGRIPALTDVFDDGKPIRLFESGSIMQYLVDRYDTEHKVSYPHGSRESWEVNNWLFFQNAGVGPMQGQANHFYRYAPEKIQYGIDRYQNETKRLYRTLEEHLEKTQTPYIVGDRCTIADIAHWGWVTGSNWAGIDISSFPQVERWIDRMFAREALQKGRNVPSPHKYRAESTQDKEAAEEEARKTREWIQKGMKTDASK